MTGEQVLDLIRQRDDGELMSLVRHIARAHNVTVNELLSSDRRIGPSEARQALWAAMTDTGHWSSSRIAEVFGANASTVRYAIIRHRNRMLREKVVGRSGMRCEQ